MKYPNRLKEKRRAAGLSQESLATAIGSGRSTIQKYEDGDRKISDEVKARLSKVLGCEPWELMAEDISPSDDEAELLKIYRDLDPERRMRLSALALDLQKAHRG
jgi:transcriptional regulator with XRE-family HTH domain